MDDVTDLIARLESAAEGSRELDRDVAEAVGWERKVVSPDSDDYWRTGDMSWTREDHEHPPQFTTSLDAALPGEEIAWTERRGDDGWRACTGAGAVAARGFGLPRYVSYAATEPLARRAAALRAIQHG